MAFESMRRTDYKPRKNRKTLTVTVSIVPDLVEKIDATVKSRDMSRAEWIREAVDEKAEREGLVDPKQRKSRGSGWKRR